MKSNTKIVMPLKPSQQSKISVTLHGKIAIKVFLFLKNLTDIIFTLNPSNFIKFRNMYFFHVLFKYRVFNHTKKLFSLNNIGI